MGDITQNVGKGHLGQVKQTFLFPPQGGIHQITDNRQLQECLGKLHKSPQAEHPFSPFNGVNLAEFDLEGFTGN
ncbi:hypothetical protein D3C76_1738890 [compost metagenome]